MGCEFKVVNVQLKARWRFINSLLIMKSIYNHFCKIRPILYDEFRFGIFSIIPNLFNEPNFILVALLQL